MGKIPIIIVALLALWIGWNVVHDGPGHAFGGLFGLLAEPQYGEADRPTRSGKLADRALKDDGREKPADDPAWWSR